MRPEVQRWLEKADGDLLHAEHSLHDGDHGWASFASQQAAEKALKAYLIERTGELVHAHDLLQLSSKAGLPADLSRRCQELAPAYVGTRYADAPPYPSEDRADEDYRTAVEVIRWVKSHLA